MYVDTYEVAEIFQINPSRTHALSVFIDGGHEREISTLSFHRNPGEERKTNVAKTDNFGSLIQ